MTDPSQVERAARAALRRIVSRRTTLRRSPRSDGRATLVVVDWHTTADAARVVRSFRRHVSDTWPVVVVQNASLARRPFEGLSARLVGPGVNLHHGLGLDWGLAFVRTEHALVCDPDSVICSPTFWPRMRELLERRGVASIDNGAAQYHPICLAFRTELWASNALSMEQDWTRGYDVAGALTELVGFDERALLQRTRVAGPAMPSRRPGAVHHLGEVYEDCFSNTYGSARLSGEEGDILEGWTRADTEAYHRRWRAWADGVAAGTASVAEFPEGPG